MIEKAVGWIKRNTIQEQGIVITSHQRTCYPEVTGYFITTLLNLGETNLALQYAQYLRGIQKPDGSFGSLVNGKSYAFDTGQIIRGWISALPQMPELEQPIRRACDWLIQTADPATGRLIVPPAGGDWNLGRRGEINEGVHLFVLAPIKQAGEALNEPQYLQFAQKSLQYYLKNCDVTHFDRPNALTHLFSYMQDALLDLGCEKEVRDAMSSATRYQQDNGAVPGYYDVNWVCSTGLAQLAIIWYRLGEKARADAALQFLEMVQNPSGGFWGSYGVNADYFPKEEISWAVKFALDALFIKQGVKTKPAPQPSVEVGNQEKRSQDNYHPLGAEEWHDSIVGQTRIEELAVKIRKGDIPEWVGPVLENTIKGDHVLELGSGTGEMSAVLAASGRNVTLLDYSQKSLDFSARLFNQLGLNGKFSPGDVKTRFPFRDKEFDVVWSSGLLEHFSDDEIVHILAESARIAKKAVISLVPNANSIAYRVGKWHQEKMGEWKWGYEDPKPTMISFFNQAGMKNVREYSIGVQHSVHFLNSPQLAPMAKILADFYRGITPHELDVLNQGYLLTTVGKTGTGLKLVVVPNDPLQAYIDAGYPDLTEYFNPLGYFEEVYCLSPWEPVERELFGMKVIPTHPAQFARRVKELGADVVRAYDVIAGRVACDNRVEGIPFIVSVHDIDPNRIPVGGLPTPDYFMAISQAVKDFLIQNGADPQKILPFANRVDVDIFKPITDADQKQAFEALYPGKYRVLFVGRLGSQKNLDNFIKALPYLGKDYQFIIVGKGDKSPYLKMAEEGGVVDQCHFVDAVPNHELAKYYSFSDCMCTPSRREGFGIVFIEAMSSGAVVITSDIPPMNEFITDGESGILIKDYENPAAIADAIRKACEDQTLRAILKENTRKAAFPFSKEAVDQQEITIYQQVVGKKKINIPAIENKHAAASMKQALPDFTVIPLTPDLKDEWDQIVNTSPDAWFYHQYEELQLIDEVWHPLQFNFLVQDKDRILAICPLQWHKGSMVIDSTVMGPAGPAFHKDIDDRERTRVMQFIAAHCKEILQQTQSYGVKAIRFFLPPLSQTNLNSWESMENPLLKFGFKDISTQTRIINLDQDEENIFKGFTKGHRSAIHKAEKFPMDIYLAAGQKDIDDYYRLHVETYTRTGVPPHPKPYFDAIWRYMGTKGTSKIFMGRLNGEVIAGTNIAAFNLASLYWTGAYGKKALEIEAGKLIQWTAIRWAKENGFHWHEVGEVFPQESKSSKLGGLTTYKSGFGGDTHLFIKGFLELE